MKKSISALLMILSPLTAQAAGTINLVDASDNLVVFATTESKTSSPSCASTETQDKWAISLDSATGRAAYTLLMTAMAGKMDVSVESANDCEGTQDYERAARVVVTPSAEAQQSGGVQWAGYSDKVNGAFAKDSRNAYLTATQQCNAKYPGSRAMFWEEYVALGDAYPMTESVWMPDLVQTFSNDDRDVIYKNGYSEYIGNVSGLASCYGWRNTGSSNRGAIMNSSGQTQLMNCAGNYALGCVK